MANGKSFLTAIFASLIFAASGELRGTARKLASCQATADPLVSLTNLVGQVQSADFCVADVTTTTTITTTVATTTTVTGTTTMGTTTTYTGTTVTTTATTTTYTGTTVTTTATTTTYTGTTVTTTATTTTYTGTTVTTTATTTTYTGTTVTTTATTTTYTGTTVTTTATTTTYTGTTVTTTATTTTYTGTTVTTTATTTTYTGTTVTATTTTYTGTTTTVTSTTTTVTGTTIVQGTSTTLTTTVTTTTTTTTGCVVKACAKSMSPPSSEARCQMIEAGKKVENCSPVSSDTMMAACLPSKFPLSCPANNRDADMQPEFAVASAIQCKLCSFDVGADKDVVKDKYWFHIKFSPLQKGKKPVASVTHYELHWVDGKGRSLETVQTIKAGVYDTKCCTKDMYKFTIRGSYPAGYSKLAIRAKSKAGFLPFTDFSGAITDTKTGKVKKTTGSFTAKMSKASIDKIKDDPKLAFTLQKSIAETIKASNPTSSVAVDDVYIKAVSVKGAGYGDGKTWFTIHSAAARRLADIEFKVDYEVITTKVDEVIDTNTIKAADLKTKIQDNAKSEMNVEVVVASVESKVEPGKTEGSTGSTTSTTNKPIEPPLQTTSGSVSKYVSSAMVAIIASAVQVLL